MKKQDQSLIELYQDFLDNKVSPEQVAGLKDLFNTESEPVLRYLIAEALKDEEGTSVRDDEQERLDAIYSRVKAEINANSTLRSKYKFNSRLVASIAAAAMLIIASLLYFNKGKEAANRETDLIAQIQPGSNKAILTLSDGSKVDLSSSKQGQFTDRSGVTATYTVGGTITYNTSQAAQSGYNTIETPKGGEFKVVLPDGTKVWLNAASSLKYPTSFGALNERRIELSGEAYFQVSHDRSKPFRVVTAVQTVEVLGTYFNVNSYADEGKTITTLEEGSVKVISKERQDLLRPGQQSFVKKDGTIAVGEADMETALAWKDGNIVFKNADIQSIMRQIARWYNIQVDYEGKPSRRLITGGMPRNTRLSVLLEVLKDSNIAFRMEENSEGKKLIITN